MATLQSRKAGFGEDTSDINEVMTVSDSSSSYKKVRSLYTAFDLPTPPGAVGSIYILSFV